MQCYFCTIFFSNATQLKSETFLWFFITKSVFLNASNDWCWHVWMNWMRKWNLYPNTSKFWLLKIAHCHTNIPIVYSVPYFAETSMHTVVGIFIVSTQCNVFNLILHLKSDKSPRRNLFFISGHILMKLMIKCQIFVLFLRYLDAIHWIKHSTVWSICHCVHTV